MEVIPAIDLLGTDAVRLEQGHYDRSTRYGAPAELARRFAADGARRLHVVDLDGARAGRIRPDVVESLVRAAAPVPVQASGGVRSVGDAEALVDAGADRVVVGTVAWTLLDELAAALGERLVVAVDVRDGFVHGRGWTESTLRLDDAIDRCVAARVPRLLCTAIDRDGTLSGPDLDLLREARAGFGGSLLAAGGIRDAADVEAVRQVGANGVVVGRALLAGSLELLA